MVNFNNSQHEIEESGLISAIWILACNDETSLMLYDSVKFRLGLPESYDVEKLIKRNAELFRHKIPKSALKQWKVEMLEGKRRPSFLIEMDDINERKKIIESLTSDDGFRSQFRSRADSPRSDINIINWGLEHIERLRKANIESKEGKWKKWKDVWFPLASLLVAFGTVLLTSYWQYQNIQAQRAIKEYEVSFKPKQESYTSFVSSASMALDSAFYGDKNSLRKTFNSMETNLYLIESLIKDENKKVKIWEDYNEFNKFLNNLSNVKSTEMTEEKYNQEVAEYRKLFGKLKSEIYQELFQQK